MRAYPTEDPDRAVFQSRHVRGAGRQSVSDHPRPRRQAGGVRRQGLGARAAVALCARRARARSGQGFDAVYLDRAGDGPAMVQDGRVAALWGAGIGWPGFQAVSDSPGGARFIAPGDSEIAPIRGKHAFLKPMTVAANSYPQQTAPIASLGSWSYILVRADLPDDVAYRLAKTLHGAEGALGARLAQARETTAANTVAAAPGVELIHPGVLKYFREIGVVK